ncbi:hypothetical protein SAMN05428962_2706 [Paenibacillus sp. BC26]|nr:hypothetical protein SAMN05428962_2706 [Paenibacillus sp. BC26]
MIFCSVGNYIKLKKNGYVSNSFDSLFFVKNWKFSAIITLGLTIFLYLLEGIKSIWEGPIFSILIMIGITFHFWIEYKFIIKNYGHD